MNLTATCVSLFMVMVQGAPGGTAEQAPAHLKVSSEAGCAVSVTWVPGP